jgi:energy-coupling factor transporter transmembrane protein EcfT
MSLSKNISQPFKYLSKNVHIVNNIHIHTDIVLHNVFILYFIFIISLIYVFYLAFQKELSSVSIFILVGFISSFFSKNMIVILFISLTFTHLYKLGNYNLEGFTDETDSETQTDTYTDKDTDKHKGENDKGKNDKKTKNELVSQEPMIADPEELDADENLKHIDEANQGKVSALNDNGLDKIQEQTKILLDTHNELLKNIETLKPFLKQADTFTKGISKIMNGSNAT